MASSLFTAAVCVALLLCTQAPASVAAKRQVLQAGAANNPFVEEIKVGVSTRQFLNKDDLNGLNLREKPLVITSGTKVWFTTLATVHDVTFDSAPEGAPKVDLGIRGTGTLPNSATYDGLIASGNKWTFANGASGAAYSIAREFTVPGTYTFYCLFHKVASWPDMTGTIIVKPKPSNAAEPAEAFVQVGLANGNIFWHEKTRTNVGESPLKVVGGTTIRFKVDGFIRAGAHNIVFDIVPAGVNRLELNSPDALTPPPVPPQPNPDFKSFIGQDHEVTLTTKGRYTFFCIPHAGNGGILTGMSGTILVV